MTPPLSSAGTCLGLKAGGLGGTQSSVYTQERLVPVPLCLHHLCSPSGQQRGWLQADQHLRLPWGTLCVDVAHVYGLTQEQTRRGQEGGGWRAPRQGGQPEASLMHLHVMGRQCSSQRPCPRTAVTTLGTEVHHISQLAEGALVGLTHRPC